MKVIIVDDEILIREWLQYCMKDIENLEIVGSAANGQEALAMYKKYRADIVLTDIKMPIMDGITLLHEIREISKESIVVLLTAYSEFEYARAAVREGASEYILKTEVSSESLQAVISKAMAHFAQKDSVSEQEENHKFLRTLLSKQDSLTTQDVTLLQEKKYDIAQEDVFAIAIYNQDITKNLKISSTLASNLYMFEYDELYYIIIGNMKEGHTDFEKKQRLRNFAKEISKQYQCKLGCSDIKRNASDLINAILQATASLSRSFYGEERAIYESIETGLEIRKRMEKENILLNQFYKAFLPMSGNEQLKTLESMLYKIGKEKFIDIHKVIFFCKEILELLYANAMNKHDSFTKSSLKKCLQQIDESFHYEEIKDIMLVFAKKNIYSDMIKEEDLSKGIQLAISYIREHYNEPLSLVDIAEYVHLNPDYFSRIFKEETGKTYIVYLTYVRLSKACDMLIHTNYKVQEIAEAVGYANVSYFSTVFKKQYDCNPYEFRRGEKSSEHK